MCTKRWTYPCRHVTKINHFDGCLCITVFQFDNADICAKCDMEQREIKLPERTINPKPQPWPERRERRPHCSTGTEIRIREMRERERLKEYPGRPGTIAPPPSRTTNNGQKAKRGQSIALDLTCLSQRLHDLIDINEADSKKSHDGQVENLLRHFNKNTAKTVGKHNIGNLTPIDPRNRFEAFKG